MRARARRSRGANALKIAVPPARCGRRGDENADASEGAREVEGEAAHRARASMRSDAGVVASTRGALGWKK